MPCCNQRKKVDLTGLVAKVVNFNNVNKTVDTTGTVGKYVRIVIKRNGFTVYRSPAQRNQGTNQVPYTITLKDGVVLDQDEPVNRGAADRPLSNDEIVAK